MSGSSTQGILESLHPEQYRLHRPFIGEIEKLWKDKKTAGPFQSTMEALLKVMRPLYNRAIMQRPFEERPEGSQRLSDELSLAMHYGGFISHGKQVFHFPSSLVEQFRQTEVDEVPGGVLKLPFPTVYLHFGAQPDLDLYGRGEFVDGAYLNLMEAGEKKLLEIILTTAKVKDKKTDPLWPFDHLGRYYYLGFEILGEEPVVKSVDNAFRADVESALQRARTERGFLSTPWGDVANRAGKTALESAAALDAGFPSMRAALRLIINGLCFLSAYPEHMEGGWGDDAPSDLVDRAKNAKTKQHRFLAKRELQRQGFTFLRIGRVDQRTQTSAGEKGASGGKMPTHWRRGHWRNQAYGPGRLDHRLVWIMPILVNKADELEAPGHVYMV